MVITVTAGRSPASCLEPTKVESILCNGNRPLASSGQKYKCVEPYKTRKIAEGMARVVVEKKKHNYVQIC